MRKTLSIAAFWLILASGASAAEIHGTVSENGKPLPRGIPLKLDCTGTSASAQTDEFGSYSLKVGAAGACALSVEYKGSTLSLKVTVYEKPSRYDLVVKEDAGKLSLARK